MLFSKKRDVSMEMLILTAMSKFSQDFHAIKQAGIEVPKKLVDAYGEEKATAIFNLMQDPDTKIV